VQFIQANGVKIAYELAGQGPSLVFAHGSATDSRLWRPQVAALGGDFTVVAWDEPGAGRSEDVPAGFGLTDYADCLAALIEALDLGPAHVAGLSSGGTIVQELYRHHPRCVATLILADTYAGWKGSLPVTSCGRGSHMQTKRSPRPPRTSIPPFPDCSATIRPPRRSRCSMRWPPTSVPRA
jgi:pimeloyl-ACP methyl ester carboxylesterase